MQCVGVYVYKEKNIRKEAIIDIVEFLSCRDICVVMSQRLSSYIGRTEFGVDDDVLWSKPDVMIVLGGDGTLLGAARKAKEASIPIFGINMGKLGFLSAAETDDLPHALEELLAGTYQVEERMMIDCFIDDAYIGTAMNDVVLSRQSIARMMTICARVDGEVVDNYQADGLVISTPTGSTAYSFSAGGPIVSPTIECILISAICPHSLYNRSVVVGAQSTIELVPIDSKSDAVLTLDGQKTYPVCQNARVVIRRAQHSAKFIRLQGHNFYRVLRSKLTGMSPAE